MISSKGEKDISVIICHHTGNLYYNAIESIKQSVKVSFEIILMTSNEELALTGIPGVLVMHDTNMPASKRNAGARLAKGKYLAFFDDDVEMDKNCLYQLLQPLAFKDDISWPKPMGIEMTVGMAYGKLWNMQHRNRFDEAGSYLTPTGFLWSRAGQNDIDNGQFDKEESVLAGKSASCMVRRDIFEKVGGFDEDFGILGEETDLSWRIWLSGHTVKYIPSATGYHAFNTIYKPKEKFYTNDRVFFNGCRNYLTMLLKNLEAKNLWRIIPIHATIWLFAGFAMIGTLKVKEGYGILRGLWYVVSNFRLIYRKRAKVQKRRQVSDASIWPSIYRKTPRGYYKQRFLRYISLGLHG